jgi:hypothetical protein
VLIVSGASACCRTTLIEVGGYNLHAVGEDMELIVRIHGSETQRRRYHRLFRPRLLTDAPERS